MTDRRIGENLAVPTAVARCCARPGAPAAFRIFLTACLFVPAAPMVGRARGQQLCQPQEARLRKVVEKLASPEFGGRSGAGGRRPSPT